MTTNKLIKRLIDLTKEENTKEEKFYKAEIDGSLPFAAQQQKIEAQQENLNLPGTPPTQGGLELPSEQRLYLTPDGKIPNTDSTPQDLKLHVYLGKKKGQYVDKRLIQKKHAGVYDQVHSKKGDSIRYGGVIIDPQTGKVLMRQPSDEAYGNRWTLAKGGADKGETPQEAALREVEEETGMKCKVTSEIPGHYQSGKDNHKYFVMEVESTSKDLGDETSDVKWMSADEAYKTLDDLDNDSATRDKDAIAAGIHEHNETNKNAAAFASMGKHTKVEKVKLEQGINDAITGFVDNGKFPDDFSTNPKYQTAYDELSWHVAHPKAYLKLDYSPAIKGISSNTMKKLDAKYGFSDDDLLSGLHSDFMSSWGVDALGHHDSTNAVNERVSKMFDLGDTYKYGKPVMPSVDSSGNQCHRSYEDKKAYVEAFDNWKAKKLEPTDDGKNVYHVKLSDGELINFDSEKKFSAPTTTGGEKKYNSWDFRYKRDKKILETDDKELLTAQTNNYYEDMGDKIHAIYVGLNDDQKKRFQNEDGELMSTVDAGKALIDLYVENSRNLNKHILDTVYPDTSHFFVGRKTSELREVAGDFGPTGTHMKKQTYDNLLDKAEENNEGVKANLHTGALGGYSTSPSVWTSKYAIIKKVNKRDVFMMPSISTTNHDAEAEIIVMNNPESSARVVTFGGKVWHGDWEMGGDNNGLHPEKMFGKVETKGITNPKEDYTKKLTPINEETDGVPAGKLGTNPGGTYTDSRGGQYYVKNDYEDKHASEQLANQFYKKLGFNVPDTELVKWKDKTALKSKWLPNGKYHQGGSALQDQSDIKDGFLVDAVLANRDVVGAGTEKPYGNLLEHEGKFYRLDQGGALEHNGLSGKKKDFHDWKNEHLSELDGFLDESVNPTTAHVFGGGEGMTNKWQTATDKLIQMKDSVIEDLVTDSGLDPSYKHKMMDTLRNRRDNALEWVIKNHKVKYNSLEEIQDSTSLLKASDDEEEKGIHLYLDEPQSDRYAWSKDERTKVNQDWEEIEDFYKTE